MKQGSSPRSRKACWWTWTHLAPEGLGSLGCCLRRRLLVACNAVGSVPPVWKRVSILVAFSTNVWGLTQRTACKHLSDFTAWDDSSKRYSLGWHGPTPTRLFIVESSRSWAADKDNCRSFVLKPHPQRRWRCWPLPNSRESRCHTCVHICASWCKTAHTADKFEGPISLPCFIGLLARAITFSNWKVSTSFTPK